MPPLPEGRLGSVTGIGMRLVFGIILGLAVIVLGGGFLSLGAFPPKPPQHAVHQVLATDKLGSQP